MKDQTILKGFKDQDLKQRQLLEDYAYKKILDDAMFIRNRKSTWFLIIPIVGPLIKLFWLRDKGILKEFRKIIDERTPKVKKK